MKLGNAEAAALIIGVLMPFLVTVVKQIGWPKVVSMLITVVLCGGAGTLTVWSTGGFSDFQVANLLIIIASIFVASQACYAAFWKNTTTENKVNIATSIKK
jgi:MFS-type transporter involved in bile tolerance (Atg22 family)